MSAFKSGLDPKTIHDGMRDNWLTAEKSYQAPVSPTSQPCTLCKAELNNKSGKWERECTNKCKEQY